MESVGHSTFVPWADCDPENLDHQRQQVRNLGYCPYCENLDRKAIETRGWPRPLLSDVQKAAADGCQCCDFLRDVVLDFGTVANVEKKLRQWTAVESPVVVLKAISGQVFLWLEIKTSKARFPKQSWLDSNAVELYRQSEGKPPKYDAPFNLGDQACIDFISTRLQKCLDNHETKQAPLPILPRRVLEIEDEHSVRLIETNGQQAHYATLSHRWGKTSTSGPKKTKLNNLLKHLTQISIDDISTTFRDAIKLTHMLGIQYLWIDSLCIVQDDKQDWVNESGKMSKTYGHSTLTIFASAPQGCFVPRAGFQKRHYHYIGESGQSIDLTAQTQLQHSHLDSPFRQVVAEDLFKRGWVFQEWLLCSRAIVFSADELLWSCDHAVCCECKPTPQEPSAVRESWNRYQYDNLLHTRIVFRLETQQDRSESSNWLRLAQAYTTTKLTIQEDRLPALSGLAKRWATYNDETRSIPLDDYFAGCWRHDLITSLLWHSVPPRIPGDPKFIDMRRNSYIAPSWSWVSLPYYLKFAFIDAERFSESDTLSRDLLSISDVQCIRTTSDPTGAVRDGRLTVSGPAFNAVLIPTKQGKQKPKLQVEDLEMEAQGDHGSVPFSRLLATGAQSFNVTCLVIRASFTERRALFSEEGLILVPCDTKAGFYERIGRFTTSRSVKNRYPASEASSSRTDEEEFDYLLSLVRKQKLWASRTTFLWSEAPKKTVTIV